MDYGLDELDELTHAYAVTIHRSQGSEYPAVVLPLTIGSWLMRQRNLLPPGARHRGAHEGIGTAAHRAGLPAAIRELVTGTG